MRAALLLLLLLAACSRPLSAPEKSFLHQLTGDAIDVSRIRVVPSLATVTRTTPVPPRITCVSRLFPPDPRKMASGASPAMTLWNTILIRSDWHAPSMAGPWPGVLDLTRALILAHEALHVWQWQQRARTRYTPFRAFGEHFAKADPYLFDPDSTAEFSQFGFEQQGAIFEEYLCCRLLAPKADRTKRLHAMISRELPLSPIGTPLAEQILLPWNGVKIEGICG